MLKMTFIKRTRFYVALLLLVALTAACGGGEDVQPAAPEPAAEENVTTAEDSEPVSSETESSGDVTTDPNSDTDEQTTSDTTSDTSDTTSDIEDHTDTPQLPMTGSISLVKTDFEPAEEILVTVDIIIHETSDAWIGIIPSDTPHGSEAENDDYDVSYAYVIGASENQVSLYAPMEPGLYDVRLFNTDDGAIGIELDSVSISIEVGDVETAGAAVDGGTDTADNSGADTEATEPEPATEEATASGNDACVVGTWRLENFDAYLVSVIQDAMAETGQEVEVTSESSGDLLLSFDGEIMNASENDFVVTASMMGVSVPTEIDASGTARYTADGNIISGIVEEVNVQESSQGLGINFTNLVGENVMYTCDGDVMAWSDPFPITLEFSRVN